MTGLYCIKDGDLRTWTLEADSWVGTDPIHNINVYLAEERNASQSWTRGSPDGILQVRYEAAPDQLVLTAYEYQNNELLIVRSYTTNGLRTVDDSMGVFVGGNTEGANLALGMAYLENFSVKNGTITPEPLSSILFIMGTAIIQIRRFVTKGK